MRKTNARIWVVVVESLVHLFYAGRIQSSAFQRLHFEIVLMF